MDTADRVLRFMDEPEIGPAFRAEIAAFLVVSGTNGTALGQLALRDSSFVHRLNAGATPRLDTVQKVRIWMRETASHGERVAIAQAIADPDAPDPLLNPDPGAYRTRWSRGSRAPMAAAEPLRENPLARSKRRSCSPRRRPRPLST